MSGLPECYAGFSALEKQLSLRPVQPLTSTCKISNSRKTTTRDGFTVEIFPQSYQPDDTLRGHFEFGLKYDDLNLEWLCRFFQAAGSGWIESWVADAPNSVYARRAGFLFEWLTGSRLNVMPKITAGYEPAISPADYLTSQHPERVQRWRILNNMPGTPQWCPLVRITQDLRQAIDYDLLKAISDLDSKFGADLLLRSAAWLTFAESRATFALERESDRDDDIKRFAAAMVAHCGKNPDPFGEESLAVIQADILGTRALRRGIRQSPVFVGSAAHHEATIVHYIAPPPQMLASLLDGLRQCEVLTRPSTDGAVARRALSPAALSLIRCGVLAFGFVYIHPMSDGNGRIHRLAINDTLQRDGQIPHGVIIPVSSTIVKSSTLRGDYEKTLNSISTPFMRRYATDYRFGEARLFPDGVESDFYFDKDGDAANAWRFPDLTRHVIFVAQVVRTTVEQNMTDEASHLARHDEAVRRLKRVYEMPDRDAEKIIRSLRENNGRVSGAMRKSPQGVVFEDPDVAAEVIEAVMSALQGREQEDVTGRGRV